MSDDDGDGADDEPHLSRERAAELEVEALLSRLESAKRDERAIADRQATLVRNGIAAGGLVLAYSFAGPGRGSLLALLVVPVIIVAVTVLSIEEDVNGYERRKHVEHLEEAILDGPGDVPDRFGSTGDPSEPEEVPFHLVLFYVVVALFYLGLVGYILRVVPQQVDAPWLFSDVSVAGLQLSGVDLLAVFYAVITVVPAVALFKHPQAQELLDHSSGGESDEGGDESGG